MDLDNILANMESQEGQTKVAASNNAGTEASALAAALEKVAGTTAQAVAAPADNPINGLVKMANAIAQTEEERDIAVSAACGSAFADAAMAKMAGWEEQVAGIKIASSKAGSPTVNVEAMQKIAADTTYAVLEYLAGQEQELLNKQAAEYDQGWNEALQNTFEATQGEFFKGAMEAEIMVNHLRQNA